MEGARAVQQSFSMNGRKLSELESCVLGVIRRTQPCTGYSVRKVFQQSLTTTWSASTGAIYPLLKKLTAEGLIAADADALDGRGGRRLLVTAKGDDALRAWLTETDRSIGLPAADLIRTRSYLLSLIDEAAQRRLIDEWRTATSTTLAAVRELGQITKDVPPDRIAFRGSELQLEARLQWLDELAGEIGASKP